MAVVGSNEEIIERLKLIEPVEIKPGFLHLELDPLTDSLKEKAKKELRETPEIVKEALAEIRKLIQDEADLIVPDNDYFLTQFLRPCKWYAKSAFALMKRYFRYLKNHPRYCENLVPKNERAIFATRILTPLPYRAKDGSRILVLQGGKIWNPKEISVDQAIRGVLIFSTFATSEPITQVNGVRCIVDLDGFSLNQVFYFKPSHAAVLAEWFQTAFPGRLRSIDIINQPYIFNMVFAIIKPFINEKYRNRVILHGHDRKALKACYGVESLPKQFGGEIDYQLSESLDDSLYNYLCNFNKEFEELEKYGYSKES
ncbi:hypothetical protein HCN44_002839 [Aphidius gifuensis]|uniref:CRAL-TRIO domain-containing protein n=1 Tax=Aphidius gifuensis TaxID=684658 RepID=A0A835CPH6_APHGI|nr:alpha-tocopherol transfer protein-like [Aphidius gifuensis]KAF7991277.1 hypothetical protein HCN44_002839 [Aphidius gifuensis]